MWLPGTYRRVIVRPDNLEWETAKYSNQTIDFSLSDWDMLEQKTLPTEHEHGEAYTDKDLFNSFR